MPVLTRLPAIVGADVSVPVGAGFRPYANFDYAASAPCLDVVQEAVMQALPYYGSVHRGAGHLSQVTSRAYEDARAIVSEFLGGPQSVVFVRWHMDSGAQHVRQLVLDQPRAFRYLSYGDYTLTPAITDWDRD